MSVIRHLILSLLLITAAVPSLAKKDIQLNLQNADLREFIETVAKITGKNIVMTPNIQGSVTLISPDKFDKKALYDIFLNVLSVNGYAAQRGRGNIIRIVPGGNVGGGFDTVSHVYRPRHVGASQIVPTLQPLMPNGSQVSANKSGNLLIISGQPADVQRALDVVKRIDQRSNNDFEVIRLRNASASNVVRTLSTLLGEKDLANTKVVADERTNSVLLQAPRPEKLRLKTLITHLDTPIENAGNTEVIYLKNANAVSVAQTLSAAKQSISLVAESNEQGEAINLTQSGEQNIDIRADESTNALIITAPPATMRNFKQVIAKLDIRRSQVLVEAIIAEVTRKDIQNLGVQWYANANSSTMPVGVIDFTNVGNSILGLAANYMGYRSKGNVTLDNSGRPANVGAGATFGVGNDNFGVLVNALNSLNNTNILSTPSLVVMDNEKAEFLVGENIPYVTGSYTTNGNGSSNPFQTVERQDVGIKLNIKPQISEGDTISLNIYQEVSNVTTNSNQQGPTTAKRAIKTTVLVEDNQVLVLGGLVDNRQGGGKQKVPVLGDIPVLGNLFKSRTRNDENRNLMIFIRPKILRTRRSANFATQEKYDGIRSSQLQHPLATPQSTLPVLEQAVETENTAETTASTANIATQTPKNQPLPPVYERSRPATKW